MLGPRLVNAMSTKQNQALVDGIEDVVRQRVISQMPADNSSGDFSTMPLRQLLGIYWTWRGRFPAARPRAVHRSRELNASPKAQEHASELAELVRKIEAGEDLTPHLSDRVETAYISGQQRPSVQPANRRQADQDKMLAAWGIHHLHISSAPGKGRFTARGRDLLYAMFRPDHAYLVGIYTHNDWAQKELVEVIVNNWPDAGLFLRSNYALGATTQFTDDDRRQLRCVNVNDFIEVNGALYGPASLGMTAAGTSAAADRRAMAYMEHLRQLRENLDERLTAFGRELDQAAGHPVTGEWKPGINEDHIGLFRGDDAFIGIPWLDVD